MELSVIPPPPPFLRRRLPVAGAVRSEEISPSIETASGPEIPGFSGTDLRWAIFAEEGSA